MRCRIPCLLGLAVFVLVAEDASADPIFVHSDDSDPASEGWSSQAPVGSTVATGAVVDDRGSGTDAWFVADTGSGASDEGGYEVQLDDCDVKEFAPFGWELEVELRVVASGGTGQEAVSVVFEDGTTRYQLQLEGAEGSADVVVRLSPTESVTLTGIGDGYHTYTLVKDPGQVGAFLFVDGILEDGGLLGAGATTNRRLFFGSEDSGGTGRAHYSSVVLQVPLAQIPPPEPGVTVITHGHDFFGGIEASWAWEMAWAVGTVTNGDTGFYAHVTPNGEWSPHNNPSGSAADEIVLVWDWASDSNNNGIGWSEAAADALFAKIIDLEATHSLEPSEVMDRPIHLIGHSRGTLVNAMVTERMGANFPDQPVDQLTWLDPHPHNLGWDPPRSQLTYSNVDHSEVYWRSDGNPLDLPGQPIPGAYNVRLQESILSLAGWNAPNSISEHSDVHVWYGATIDPTEIVYEGFGTAALEDHHWWEDDVVAEDLQAPLTALQECNETRDFMGYYRSRVGQGPLLKDVFPNHLGAKSPVGDDLHGQIFNGDFELMYGAFKDKLPGWELHGGGGSGHGVLLAPNYLQLDDGGQDYFRRHNPMYIPKSATGIAFDYWVRTTDDTDLFSVSLMKEDFSFEELPFAGTGVTQRPLNEPGPWTSGFVEQVVELDPETQSDVVRRLEFRIVAGGDPDAVVRIDNVRFTFAGFAACDDGIDNDGDGRIDWDGGGVGWPDNACRGNPLGTSEGNPPGCGLGFELALLLPPMMRRYARRLRRREQVGEASRENALAR